MNSYIHTDRAFDILFLVYIIQPPVHHYGLNNHIITRLYRVVPCTRINYFRVNQIINCQSTATDCDIVHNLIMVLIQTFGFPDFMYLTSTLTSLCTYSARLLRFRGRILVGTYLFLMGLIKIQISFSFIILLPNYTNTSHGLSKIINLYNIILLLSSNIIN